MVDRINKSLTNINWKLFISLLIMGLCPTIYNTLRIFWLGELPSEYSYSIAGQLSWINLIYEIMSEAIILPLFYFMGKVLLNQKEFINRIKTGLIISFGLYLVLSGVVIIFTEPLIPKFNEILKLMATSTDIIDKSIDYIRLEALANIFLVLANFGLVALVTYGKDKYVYILTFVKLVLAVILDVFLLSNLSISLNLGINGVAVANIITNIIMLVTIIIVLYKIGINIFNKEKLDFKWTKELFKVGGISGIESLVRNLFYIIMISRMINVVGEQGTYWVANNFIWGWLLLPVIQLGELIKQEVAMNKENVRNNTLGYLLITLGICILWVVSIPLYKPFMRYVLNYSDIDKLYNLVMVLLGFYVLYAFQNIFDATFYGLGKTHYMLLESIVTNVIYYGVCFILYITNVFEPTLLGIALMFGIGNAFDSIVSGIVYWYMIKKEKYELV